MLPPWGDKIFLGKHQICFPTVDKLFMLFFSYIFYQLDKKPASQILTKNLLCPRSATLRVNTGNVLCQGSKEAQKFAHLDGSCRIRAFRHNAFCKELNTLSSQQILVFTDNILSRTQMALGVDRKIVANNIGSNK